MCRGGVFIGVCAFAQVTPTISSFSPGSGSISTSVTITGSNFNVTANQNVVFFGATQATVTGATSTSLTVTVPYGANYQYISVTNLGTNLTAYSARPFVVTYATGVLNDFAPANNIIVGTGASILSASIGDMDKDGLTDLIISDSGVNLVKVYRNTSVGNNLSFSLSASLSTASVPRNIAVGDLNGDGYLDMVVGTSGASNIYVYRNKIASVGSLSFTTSLTLATNS